MAEVSEDFGGGGHYGWDGWIWLDYGTWMGSFRASDVGEFKFNISVIWFPSMDMNLDHLGIFGHI